MIPASCTIRRVEFLCFDRNRYERQQPAALIRYDGELDWLDEARLREDMRLFGNRLSLMMALGYYLLLADGYLF